MKSGLDLQALEQRTGVRRRLLELVERGQFSELPRGLYARTAVRAYAAAVGCDAEETLEALQDLLPQPEDPIDGLARVRGWERPARRRLPASEQPQAVEETTTPPPFDWRRYAAAAVDGGVLAGVAVLVLQATAFACRVPLSVVLESAAPATFVLTALIGGLYFLVFGGILNSTPGNRLAGMPQPETERTVSGRAALTRAGRCALVEGSLLVDLLLAIRRLPIPAGIPSGLRMRRRAAGEASAP